MSHFDLAATASSANRKAFSAIRAPGIEVDFKQLVEATVPAVRKDPRPTPIVLETTKVVKRENHRRRAIAAWSLVPA